MVERIRELCKQKGTSFAALEKRLGMGNATLKKANNKMQAVRLKALADYFGVAIAESFISGHLLVFCPRFYPRHPPGLPVPSGFCKKIKGDA